ncbi:MAG: hypothetical protein Q8J64_08975 [Thermodesulfovibrionales bacterium]|nr:hypothetical protein [Thermodesulfovibrionales bacterium]
MAMDIAKSAQPGDRSTENGGLDIFLEPKADGMLSEATIDFTDAHGFVITGQQKNSCCG